MVKQILTDVIIKELYSKPKKDNGTNKTVVKQ